jgi:hypothetical protein
MEFMWKQEGPSRWQLVPSMISVREDAPGLWNIYVGEFSLVPLNYTNHTAARRDAWVHARRHRREYFGVYWERSMKLQES